MNTQTRGCGYFEQIFKPDVVRRVSCESTSSSHLRSNAERSSQSYAFKFHFLPLLSSLSLFLSASHLSSRRTVLLNQFVAAPWKSCAGGAKILAVKGAVKTKLPSANTVEQAVILLLSCDSLFNLSVRLIGRETVSLRGFLQLFQIRLALDCKLGFDMEQALPLRQSDVA